MKKAYKPAIFLLTCVNDREASAIADSLLKKHLIACAKKIPVKSQFHWKGKREAAEEIVLLLESREDKFSDIESVVRTIHSHTTFVLMTLPTSRVSAGIKEWIDENLQK